MSRDGGKRYVLIMSLTQKAINEGKQIRSALSGHDSSGSGAGQKGGEDDRPADR